MCFECSDEKDLLLATSAAITVFPSTVLVEKLKKKPKRYLICPTLLARRKYITKDFVVDLILNDEDALSLEYRSGAGFRSLSSSTWARILKMISLKIARQNTPFWKAIPAHVQLVVTCRFLATGDSYHSLPYTFKNSDDYVEWSISHMENKKHIYFTAYPHFLSLIIHTLKTLYTTWNVDRHTSALQFVDRHLLTKTDKISIVVTCRSTKKKSHDTWRRDVHTVCKTLDSQCRSICRT